MHIWVILTLLAILIINRYITQGNTMRQLLRIIASVLIILLVALIFAGSLMLVNRITTGDPYMFFLSDQQSNSKSLNGITQLEVDYYNKQIYMDITTDKAMSCEEVTRILGISPIYIESRMYFPACKVIGDRLIQIIYRESIAS